jgi:two-component system, chemotaxis family, sensor kinase CheA
MKRILIIEDDPLTARVYRNHLEKAGFEVEVAADGETGFNRLVEFVPDGILLDVMMPKVNGVEFVKKVRAIGQFQRLPVIAYTNAYVPAMVQQIMAAGANHVFDKATVSPIMLVGAFKESLPTA